MSQQPPQPGPPEPPGWAPPAGWSPEQPPAWGAPAPGPAGPPSPPPGYGPPPTGPTGWGQPPQPWGPPPAAPKPGIVPLRPIGVGELLDGALGLIRSNPRTVLGLAAAISAISALIQTVGLWASLGLVGASATLTPEITGDVESDLAAILTLSVAQVVPALVAGFLQVLASGLFIVLVAAAVLGRRLDAGQTWALLRPRLGALVGLTILLTALGLLAVAALVGIIVLLAVTLGAWAVLPGVLIGLGGLVGVVHAYVKLAVAAPALVIEGLGPIDSLRRSWGLVRGSWWRVLGILLLSAVITNLLTGIVSVPISTVAGVITGFSESLLPTVLAAGLATLLAGILTLPFSAAVTGLLYTDLRMRREALDIQLVSAGVDPHGDPLAPYRRMR